MTNTQKKALLRIMLVFLMLVPILVTEHLGMLSDVSPLLVFAICMVPYAIIGYDVIYEAVRRICRGQVFDENFLMLLATVGAIVIGEYSEAVAVLLFYQTGELFQDYAVGKSRQSISNLMELCPEYANVERDGELLQVDPDEVSVGDVIVVKPGERVPLDGVVLSGESFLDTAALTGESVPRRASVGDEVISGCVNGSGTLRVRTSREFEDSTVSKILELVENASARKAKSENFITKFAKYYTPAVTIGAVLLALIPPLILHGDWFSWLYRACTFLVISCPCALVISVPLGFFGGIGAASRIGVLVKGSNYLEAMARVTTFAMDKTGTLTKGVFAVVEVAPEGMAGEELLELAAYGEGYSGHPIAAALKEAYQTGDYPAPDMHPAGMHTDAGKTCAARPHDLYKTPRPAEEKPERKQLVMDRVTDAEEIAGHGVRARIDGCEVLLGNEKLMEREGISYVKNNTAGTVVYVARDKKFAGSIVISDTVKEGAGEAIAKMKESGVKKVVMLTGDRKEAAAAVAGALGVDEVRAELLPQGKVECVEELLQNCARGEFLAFVGDGMNDAPVLMRADVGIAMGSLGSDAAIEAADIVLMDDDIGKIAKSVQISRKTLRIVKENIVFALAVKFLVLVLGAFGIANMWAAVFADVGVSVIAILNSMRLLRVRPDISPSYRGLPD